MKPTSTFIFDNEICDSGKDNRPHAVHCLTIKFRAR